MEHNISSTSFFPSFKRQVTMAFWEHFYECLLWPQRSISCMSSPLLYCGCFSFYDVKNAAIIEQNVHSKELMLQRFHSTTHHFYRPTTQSLLPFTVIVTMRANTWVLTGGHFFPKHAEIPHLFWDPQRNMAVLVEYCRLFWRYFRR